MNNLEIAKGILKTFINDNAGLYGLYNSRNIVGDKMTTIYSSNGLMIDYCCGWDYFEVFGLTEEDFENLKSYYNRLVKKVGY